ncbi:MAG: Crp/Fnr family transcriptional regulator, partial [Bacteroidota bacterium]
ILKEYTSRWQAFSCGRKELISTPEKMEKYLYYVVEGVQKSYYLSGHKQHVIFFAYAPSFSGVVESFLTQTPSKYFLESVTESHFLRISYHHHQEMIAKYRSLETLFRVATESFLLGVIGRHHELMAFDMEKRFRTFLQRSPHLLNLVPHKDLASYLRIDSTNFSKLINSVPI